MELEFLNVAKATETMLTHLLRCECHFNLTLVKWSVCFRALFGCISDGSPLSFDSLNLSTATYKIFQHRLFYWLSFLFITAPSTATYGKSY